MPNTKTAKKAFRQNIRRRQNNLKTKDTLKTAIKEYKRLFSEGKKEDARKHISLVYKRLDKSAKVKLINKNKASRLKSRLSKLLATNG